MGGDKGQRRLGRLQLSQAFPLCLGLRGSSLGRPDVRRWGSADDGGTHGALHCAEDGIWITKADLGFGWVHIDIHSFWGQIHHHEGNRIPLDR